MSLLELVRFRDEMSALLVHDLKNPTSIIELSLDYLKAELPHLSPLITEAIVDARSATDRLTRIVTNMLDLARLEADRLVLHRTLTRPADLLGLVVETRAMVARKRDIHLELTVDREVEVNADVDLLTRVIENVVDNSFRHVLRGPVN